ncbi:MAG: arginase [Xanthobacteraceae bacterium]|nr:MAG: arginase [Xanthobacteraceae bacterium]
MRDDLTTAVRSRHLTVVGVACGAGARDDRCKDGPARFRESAAADALRDQALDWRQTPEDLCAPHLMPLQAIARTAAWVANVTHGLAARGDNFAAIGGDHSCAIGIWSGVAEARRSSGPLGLIWIDAHMDMHVPGTSHSGAINGMPAAVLLGHGFPELTAIARVPAIKARHICLVGVRSFEPEEAELMEGLGIRVIGINEVRRHGIEAALAEARAIATDGTCGYGVSLDLDAFDPADAPGVGTPVPEGIRANGFLDQWRVLCRDPACCGIEIAEYNPALDIAGRTVRLMGELVTSWAGREKMHERVQQT